MNVTVDETSVVRKLRGRIGDLVECLGSYESLDANLFRWIKAAHFDLTKAEEMLRNNLKWRADRGVDNFNNLEVSEYLLHKMPLFIPCGHDKEGAIIIAIQFGRWSFKSLLRAGHGEAVEQYLLQLLERFIYCMNVETTDGNIQTKFVLILDNEKYKIRQFLSSIVLRFLSDFLTLMHANYPERIKAVFVLNAPKTFDIFWLLFKPMITCHTGSKVYMLRGSAENWKKALRDKIDPSSLPSIYGGSNTALPLFKNSNIPFWLPRARQFPLEEFSTVLIRRGKTFIRSYELERGHRISWNFKTEAASIGFQFLFNDEPLYPYCKADAHIFMQDGLQDISMAGTYSLVFDNTNGRSRMRILHFAIFVEQIPEAI